MRTRQEVETAIDITETELDRAREVHTGAIKKYGEADEKYIDSGSGKDLQKKRDASDELDRYQTLLKRAQDRLDQLKIELSQIDRAESVAEYQALKCVIAGFHASAKAESVRFVELDRELDRRVLALATQVREVGDAYDRAERLADELRMTSEFRSVVRPELAAVCLETQRELARLRVAEQRVDYSAWLRSASLDWRTRNLDHRELAHTEEWTRRARQEEHDSALLLAGAALPRDTEPVDDTKKETIQ
jgi:hypothetical protein